ncbi:MAG: hypothetical protein HY391_03370 [Deltaproteobacteria bacterium]|nr:hypothetical protein [Deltaproteobacteria bacterium]
MMRLPLTTLVAAILLNLSSGLLYSSAEVRSARSLPGLLKPLTTPLISDKAPLTSAKRRIERLRHLLTLYEPLLKELAVDEQIKTIHIFAQTHLLLAELIRDLPPRLTAGEPYYEHFYLHQENLSLPLLDKTADLSRRIVEIAKKNPSGNRGVLWAREFLANHEAKRK